jgi:hypothetical protein
MSRRFHLERDVDVSGISGTGIVAEGVEFSDGAVVIRWVTGKHRSTVVWPGIADVEAIHGHGGATRIVWDDELTCRHCGQAPDEDGDHACPCPHPDGLCPDHDRSPDTPRDLS